MSLLSRAIKWAGRSRRFLSVLMLAIVLSGCHATRESGVNDEGSSGENKIVADAYSFNAKIWRDGKPTSFKLELYCTDTLIGIAARGYLGKGAFRGWLSRDSIRLYFPTSHEVLYESLDDLVAGSDCGVSVAGLGFMQMFFVTPDSVKLPVGVALRSDNGSAGKPSFRMESENPDCPWGLDLVYGRQSGLLTPEKLKFDNGRDVVLKADRERFRARIGIPQKRFTVDVPPDAVRIIP